MVDLIALGPLELWHDGRRHDLGPPMHRRVLAVLLHARGKPVSTEKLADCVWGESEARVNSAGVVRPYISRLRAQLKTIDCEGRLQLCPPGGYQLVVGPDEVDLLRFDRLRHRAGVAMRRGDSKTATELLRKAEALWRGEPLTEFTSDWASAVRSRLHEELLRVKEQRIELALARGEHSDLVGELQELVAQNPTAEKSVGYLMLALYRSERPTEAQDVYRTTYRRMKDQGTSPKEPLRRLNHQIITQDPVLDLPAARHQMPEPSLTAAPATEPAPALPPARPTSPPSPRVSLPPDNRDFIGRKSELAALLATIPSSEDDSHATAPPIHVLLGMASVGKTATAIRAAHRLADRFPDGVHFVDLRGYSDESRCDPHEALAILLRTSGAVSEPAETLEERTAQWREWTARHSALVVLDNAYDTQQVTPLLPVSPSCRAIVTSRVRLSGLDGARDLYLDALSETEARELFRRIAGSSRTTDDAALRRIVDACSRNPLVLQLLASRYRARTSWDLEHLYQRLTQSRDPLEEFAAPVAQALQLSYAELAPSARTLLRRLALHTGHVVALGGASALLGTDPLSARQAVEALQDAHLLTEGERDRFSTHDLIRVFARQVYRRDEPEATAHSASHRLLAYYLHSADHADRVANPWRRRLRVLAEPTEVPVHAEQFTDADEASAWLNLEQANLLAAARKAIESAPGYVPRFAHVLAPTLQLWGVRRFAAHLHSEAIAQLRNGIERRSLARALTDHADILAQESPRRAIEDASEALTLFEKRSDSAGCADALLQMGRGLVAVGRLQDALKKLDRALLLYRNSGSLLDQAETLNVKAVALHYQGDHRAAQEGFRTMLTLARQISNLHLESRALNNLGDLARLEERFDDAREHLERARDLISQIGGIRSRTIVECNLVTVYKNSGEPERALAALRRILDTYRTAGDTSGEADTLVQLGEVYARTDRPTEALRYFAEAEEVARSIQNGYEQQRALVGIADVHRISGHMQPAHETYDRALRISLDITYPRGSARALDGLARTAMSTPGNEVAARKYAKKAIALYQRLGAAAESATLQQSLFDAQGTGPETLPGAGDPTETSQARFPTR